ncbi:MAG: MFS transporter [Chloroflexi bacterium]|nr:MFS transporter [Chloroflexota bacterium]
MARNPISAVSDLFERGPESLINLSVYGAGLTGLWTAVTSVILQFKVLDVVDESDKIIALSTITLAGLVFAAIVQPIAGGISDRSQPRLGKRVPYIAFGCLGIAAATMLMGLADHYMSLLLAFCLMQIFGNIAQGPANALLIDHVAVNRRGTAAGALTFARSIGAGIAVIATLFLLGRHTPGQMSVWMWGALGFVAAMAIGTGGWTVFALRPRRRAQPPTAQPRPADARIGDDAQASLLDERKDGGDFIWFLVAFAIATGTMSVLSRFALYFLQDVVGLENPAQGALYLALSVGGGLTLSVLPAGALSDRLGRLPLLLAGGVIGAVSVALITSVESLSILIVVGLFVGFGSGALLSVAWALANDLVRPSRAGRSLGYTSLALLVGAVIPMLAGLIIDFLNRQSENLGYRAMIWAVAGAFIVVPALLSKIKAARTVPSRSLDR